MSVNDITGDELRSKPLSKKGKDNHVKIFGDKPIQRGSWVMRNGKLVPKGEARRERGLDIFVDNMEAYDSPITGKVIRNRQERDRDLKENGCRPYEGLASEKREAENYKRHQDSKTQSEMRQSLEKNYYSLENGYKIN